jgi:hypothetical protein
MVAEPDLARGKIGATLRTTFSSDEYQDTKPTPAGRRFFLGYEAATAKKAWPSSVFV